MLRPNQSAAIVARSIVVIITLILAISTIVGPSASAEGSGVVIPPVETGEDTLGTPPPLVQQDDLGFFEIVGIYLQVIF